MKVPANHHGKACRLLDREAVVEVLADLQRYVPQQDPRQTLMGDPTWILRLERRALCMHGAWAHGASFQLLRTRRTATMIRGSAGLLQWLRRTFMYLSSSSLGLALALASVTQHQSQVVHKF